MSLLKEKKKRRGAYCFICGCVEDDESDVGHGFGRFEVNKKRLSEWEKLIPKPGLKIGSAICGRHFDNDDIVKGREIGGVFHPFKKWSLKELAVPKHILCKPVDPLAKSLNCSQAKKGEPKIHNAYADCNKGNHKAHASKFSNNGGTGKQIPLSDCGAGNCQLLISKASNNGSAGTLINLASPCEPSEMMEIIIPMDQNVPAASNLFGVAQGEGSVTIHDIGANDLPAFSDRLAPTESVATDSGFSTMDHEPSDQGEGNAAVRDLVANDLPAFSDRLPPTESEAADAGFSNMDHEPTLSSAESESVSGDPKTSSTNDHCYASSSITFNFDTLKRIVKLPANWFWHNNSCSSGMKCGKDVVQKIVFITSVQLTFFVNGREVIFPFLKNSKLWKPVDLQRALYEFDPMYPCPGMLDLSLHTDLNVKRKYQIELRSLKCRNACDKNERQCRNCRIDEKKLKYLKVVQSRTVASLTKRLKSSQRRVQRFIVYRENAAETVNNLRRRIRALSAKKLSKKIKNLPQ